MNIYEALKALSEGEKIRPSYWDDNEYMQLVGGVLRKQVRGSMSYMPICDAYYELAKEPEPNLGPEHVGRRVKVRNGRTTMCIEYRPGNDEPIVTSLGYHSSNGRIYDKPDDRDIVELLP